MKLYLYPLGLLLFISLNTSAQWLSRAAFPGTACSKSTSFTTGNKIYVMGGVTNASVVLNDFWEYDIAANSWQQKPNFPGPERYGAAAFVINGKGYIATGGNDNGYLDDLWEYNPTNGVWTQRTGLPAGSPQHENQRVEAYAFPINGKGYLGGGSGFVFGANQTFNIAFYDLWEYNQVSDTWNQKSDIPDFTGRFMSIGVACNGKGYVGLGCDVNQSVNHQTFWEYDPLLNSWTSKTNFPTVSTVDAGAFAIDSSVYVLGGVNISTINLSNQFYRYDVATDTWNQLTNFNGGAVAGEFAVSTGTTAFAGTGYNGNLLTRTDVWQFGSLPTIVNEIQNGKTFIYPNPATNFVTITSQKQISSFELFDATGRLIMKESNGLKYFDVAEFASGIYQVNIFFEDGTSSSMRLLRSN
jgi:N-acetylneuraminic acid mutarotase